MWTWIFNNKRKCLHSSVGRASDWRSEGRVFDPRWRHYFFLFLKTFFFFGFVLWSYRFQGGRYINIYIQLPFILFSSFMYTKWRNRSKARGTNNYMVYQTPTRVPSSLLLEPTGPIVFELLLLLLLSSLSGDIFKRVLIPIQEINAKRNEG